MTLRWRPLLDFVNTLSRSFIWSLYINLPPRAFHGFYGMGIYSNFMIVYSHECISYGIDDSYQMFTLDLTHWTIGVFILLLTMVSIVRFKTIRCVVRVIYGPFKIRFHIRKSSNNFYVPKIYSVFLNMSLGWKKQPTEWIKNSIKPIHLYPIYW